MVCEHPDWGFIECYREVTGIEYKLLERLCEKHTNKIIAEDLTIGINSPTEKPVKKLTNKEIIDHI